MLEKNFQPDEAEPRIYARWESKQAFAAGRAHDASDGKPYCIVIPPPNVTGSLHMGHALNNTIQDILIRFERMRGRDVLWQPGMDHAGIATQMVVERQLAENGEPGRRDMGREKFIERVWEWKAESGGTIINQLKRLGASCDWSRERFTMDEGLSEAVTKVFVELYNEGLIYRGKRLVNWDPHFETAISDLEVENVEVDGQMWHFKYPLQGGATYEYLEKDEDGNITLREERDYISIATTRPETMLGDGAVAVHPDDERYAPIVGKLCEIPVGPKEHRRLIPIITDDYPDPEFGSGAVKITGAHDFNDYQVAIRNNIPPYRLMDVKAAMRDDGAPYAECAAQAAEIVRSGKLPDEAAIDSINLVPDEYRGLDRYEARKQIVEAINAEGLAVTTKDENGNEIPFVENNKIKQPFGDRSKVVIEPMLTDQWFADAKTLAQPAIKAVRDGSTKFVPTNWENTYFNWMENIEPWCISRQLWWGHQIPAWFGPDGEIFVAPDEAEALYAAEKHYGEATELARDPDVLDTWFSSALWSFSTLGWPDETPELQKYYPTSVLVTGFDIIFFWVARMMMFGLQFKKEIPFDTVYVHALVRDEDGQKMSKSKGNVIDPLDLIDEYGADALRFTLAAMAAQGRDVRLAKSRVEGYRNFSTKLWNAARFAQMNECIRDPAFDPTKVSGNLNRWVAGEVQRAQVAVTQGIEAHRYNEAAAALYQFIWHVFCDWYLELAKPVLSGEDDAARDETRATTAWVLEQILLLLHPFMPFVTEELWSELGFSNSNLLMQQVWPSHAGLQNAEADAEVGWLIDTVTQVRSVRAEMNVPAGTKVPMVMVGASSDVQDRLAQHEVLICRLARISELSTGDQVPQGSAQIVTDDGTIALPLGDVMDLGAEKERLEREIDKISDEIRKFEAKLANESFTSKAPAAVVEEQKQRKTDAEASRAKLAEALDLFRQMS